MKPLDPFRFAWLGTSGLGTSGLGTRGRWTRAREDTERRDRRTRDARTRGRGDEHSRRPTPGWYVLRTCKDTYWPDRGLVFERVTCFCCFSQGRYYMLMISSVHCSAWYVCLPVLPWRFWYRIEFLNLVGSHGGLSWRTVLASNWSPSHVITWEVLVTPSCLSNPASNLKWHLVTGRLLAQHLNSGMLYHLKLETPSRWIFLNRS